MKQLLIAIAVITGAAVAMPAASYALSQNEVAENARLARDELRQTVEERSAKIETLRQEVKDRVSEKKATISKEKCERNQARLGTMTARISQSATTQQRVLDTMLERVTAFYESEQLSAENYDELLAAVEVSKADTATALELLGESETTIDCANTNLASELSTYRESVTAVRSQIKQYRENLVNLIKAMNASDSEATTEEQDNV